MNTPIHTSIADPAKIGSDPLWIGHAWHLRQPDGLRFLFQNDIRCVIDLSDKESLPATFPRTEIAYCRFPLSDSNFNEPHLLRMAVRFVAESLKEGVPMMVCCSYGMSRSPAIVAAAMHINQPDKGFTSCLMDIKNFKATIDVDAGLLAAVMKCCAELTS